MLAASPLPQCICLHVEARDGSARCRIRRTVHGVPAVMSKQTSPSLWRLAVKHTSTYPSSWSGQAFAAVHLSRLAAGHLMSEPCVPAAVVRCCWTNRKFREYTLRTRPSALCQHHMWPHSRCGARTRRDCVPPTAPEYFCTISRLNTLSSTVPGCASAPPFLCARQQGQQPKRTGPCAKTNRYTVAAASHSRNCITPRPLPPACNHKLAHVQILVGLSCPLSGHLMGSPPR